MKEAKIRALIADDELLARKFIRRILKQDHEVEIVGECSNGKEAVAMIRKQQPDVVFLDIQMPEMDGFKVLESLGLDHLPESSRPRMSLTRFELSSFTLWITF